jgi:hypothetical protein
VHSDAVKCKPLDLPLIAGTVAITPSQSVKNQGVILDPQLTMNDEIISVYRKSYFHISCIARIRKYLSRSSAVQIVHAFVTPTLDYGNSLLVGLPAKRLLKLQRVQNSAARFVYGVRDVESISAVLKSLYWLPIESRIVFEIAMFTYTV